MKIIKSPLLPAFSATDGLPPIAEAPAIERDLFFLIRRMVCRICRKEASIFPQSDISQLFQRPIYPFSWYIYKPCFFFSYLLFNVWIKVKMPIRMNCDLTNRFV